MLAYQHAYHAGNLADVHKHALLAEALAYLVRKPKPLHYIDTHSGRGIYDLAGAEAIKTGEATSGILTHSDWFGPQHPYRRALADVRSRFGHDAYPGSPAIAATLLRDMDEMTLVERHPGEIEHLRQALPGARVLHDDGWRAVKALTPPQPRRGLMLVDPSYELPEDFENVRSLVAVVRRKWPVGILMIWYPL
ncbi:MAG: 23S rRNA (adenine(2030)-N(6))-methyltransferase RlmJ [Pseudomonadota bacterium]